MLETIGVIAFLVVMAVLGVLLLVEIGNTLQGK
jgi:hypothetical protein